MPYAIQIAGYGPPAVLTPVELPFPDLGPDEVWIEVIATAVNRSDVNVRSGRHPILKPNPFPYIPGIETLGTVAARGKGVTMPLGTRVITMMQKMGGVHAHRPGGYQSHVVAPVSTVATLNPGLDPFGMAALGLAAVTAYQGLMRLALQAGQRVLVTGASGGVGSAALGLAKAWGAWTIATTTQPAKAVQLRELGADEVWDVSDGQWERSKSGPVDSALELVCGPTFTDCLLTVRPGGQLCVLGALGGGDTKLSVWDLFDGIQLTGYSTEHLTRDELQETVNRLSRLVETGRLKPPPTMRYPLKEAARAHADMERNALVGRQLLIP